MPTVYRVKCESCGRAPQATPGVAGYVTFDGREGGVILPAGYWAVELDNGVVVCLPHPVESSRLKEHRLTWIGVTVRGRLNWVEYKICNRCGILHEDRQVRAGTMAGCSLGLLLGAIAALFLRFKAQSSWVGALFIGYLTINLVLLVLSLFVRLVWCRKNAKLKLRQCNGCGGNEFTPIIKAGPEPLICSFCHTRSVECKTAGKS